MLGTNREKCVVPVIRNIFCRPPQQLASWLGRSLMRGRGGRMRLKSVIMIVRDRALQQVRHSVRSRFSSECGNSFASSFHRLFQ